MAGPSCGPGVSSCPLDLTGPSSPTDPRPAGARRLRQATLAPAAGGFCTDLNLETVGAARPETEFVGRWGEPGDAAPAQPRPPGTSPAAGAEKGAELGGPACPPRGPGRAGVWPRGTRGSRGELGEEGSPWPSSGAGLRGRGRGQRAAGTGNRAAQGGIRGEDTAHVSCRPGDGEPQSPLFRSRAASRPGVHGQGGRLALRRGRLGGGWL